ncbi:chemotaxis protein CheW [Maridesulfovibrio sp.]|uniref:chemotaxis protein CheW n=1 Tax=Maridesulfovibrio sp. TaxID=2795000 RepID=UPI0029F52FAC|nr:chemotaxis protein CheW [Maridesulfovibrio sp.]
MEGNTLDYIRKERDKELLRKRAEKLALQVSDLDSAECKSENDRDYVFFRLGPEVFCLETSIVKEVLIPDDIVAVPCTPDFHLGVISVRGHLWAVVDLCKFLGMRNGLEAEHPGVVLISSGDAEFCLAVDEIIGVNRILNTDIKSLPSGDDRISEYCLGITGDRRIVLDGSAFLHDESLIVNEFVGSIS